MNGDDTYSDYPPESRNQAFRSGMTGGLVGNVHQPTTMQENLDRRFHDTSILALANSYATPNATSMSTYARKEPYANFQRQLASGEMGTQNEATP